MYQRPTIYNVTLTTAGTEYSQLLPEDTHKLQIKGRGNAGANIKLAFVANGTVAGPYMTIPAGGQFSIDLTWFKDMTLYLNGDANLEVCEILVFTR